VKLRALILEDWMSLFAPTFFPKNLEEQWPLYPIPRRLHFSQAFQGFKEHLFSSFSQAKSKNIMLSSFEYLQSKISI
jgi:hypothetical protein